MITDKKNNNKLLGEDNDLIPEDLVTLEAEGTGIKIFLAVLCLIILTPLPAPRVAKFQ